MKATSLEFVVLFLLFFEQMKHYVVHAWRDGDLCHPSLVDGYDPGACKFLDQYLEQKGERFRDVIACIKERATLPTARALIEANASPRS